LSIKADIKTQFAAFYRENRDRAWAYALSITKDSATAEDVVAGAFERLYRRRRTLRFGGDGAKRLLFKSVRNASIDELRRQSRQAIPTETLPEVAVDPAADIEQIDLIRRVRSAVMTLELADRELVVLKFWADLSNVEIAKLTGLSASNVGSRLHRILPLLATELARDGYADSGVTRSESYD